MPFTVRHELEPARRRDAARPSRRATGDVPGFAAGIIAQQAKRQFREGLRAPEGDPRDARRSCARPRPPSRTQQSRDVVVDDAARLHRRRRPSSGRRSGSRRSSGASRAPVAVARASRYSHISSCERRVPVSRSASTPRAFAIAASILPRWRTMPASPSRRSTSRSPKRATASGSKPGERRAEALALAQDRDPREPGLESLEAEALVQAALVAHRPAPLLVVVRDVGRVGRRPAADRLAFHAGSLTDESGTGSQE